jgi:hypothetical protein
MIYLNGRTRSLKRVTALKRLVISLSTKPTDGLAGQGRNPFPSVESSKCHLTDDKSWLYRGEKWQIGDNVEYPARFLYVRDVNKHMFRFIRRHFEEAGQEVDIPVFSGN